MRPFFFSASDAGWAFAVSLSPTIFVQEDTMFERTLASSWDERSRRSLTTLISFGVQALVAAVLLIVPLLRPTGIPLLRQLTTPISLGQPEPEGPSVRPHSVFSVPSRSSLPAIFLQPSRIPNHIATGDDAAQPPALDSGSYVAGPGGTLGQGVFGSLGTGSAPVIPAAPATPVQTVRLSHMSEGDLVHKVLPTYPPLARSARIQGTVVLAAMISKAGTIENLRQLSGHPMLAPAAIEAVRQWRYRPYILNSKPVEVETQITVNFSLAGN
jgi:protein TonB